jgi:streptogramin lyase
MTSRSLVLGQLGALVGAGLLAGCDGARVESVESATSALAVSAANLSLQTLTNSCGANQVQDFFNVTNNGTSPVAVSDISIKLWADETSAAALVAQISTGGCLANASGSCVHQVTGVTATATRFSPACGSDANHQADWEITISSTDHTTLGAGLMWKNVEVALHLATFANFTPGAGQWYSACLGGTSFTSSSEFAVYVAGGLVTASTGVPPSCRAPHGSHQLTGEIPPGVSDATLVGPLPGATPLTVGIGLPLQGDPQSFIQQLYDPTSPNFGKYLTPDGFGAAYGVTQTIYNNLIAFIQTKGLTIAKTYSGRHLLMVKGTAAAIESTFFVTLNVYKRPDGTTFYAPANEPSLDVDATVPIDYISGLNSYAVATRAAASGGGTGPSGCNPNQAANSFTGKDFRNIYFPGCTTLDGSGQIIGLFERADYYSADLNDFEAFFGIGNPSVTRVPLPTAPPLPAVSLPCAGVGGVLSIPSDCLQSAVMSDVPLTSLEASLLNESEAALDVEMLVAMAPKASIRVYEANTGNPAADSLTILNAMADEPAATRPSVISSSWVWFGGAPDPAVAKVFVQLAMQGQSFFQSAGDTGAYTNGGGLPVVIDPIIDSPLMTVVGGTALTTTGAGATLAYASETAWNDTPGATGGCSITSCSASTGTCGCNAVGSGGLVNGYTVCQTPVGVGYQPPGTKSSPLVSCASASYPTISIPWYQANLPGYLTSAAAALGQLSTTTRMIPDVAMIADQIAVFQGALIQVPGSMTTATAVDPIEGCSGGTSAATPLWAAVMAMANQQQQALSLPSIGFANPHLYATASAGVTNYSGLGGAFHDVAAGNNVYAGNTTSPTAYQAVAGYDMVTGLGSPNGLICNPLKVIPPQKCQILPSTPGVITEFPIPTVDADPVSITRGTDCNMWFTELSNGKIGRITPAGVITEFPVTGFDPVDSFVINITTGPDDALWFTTQLQLVNHYIGRIDTSGAETFYKLDSLNVQGHSIVAGADGNLWFGTGLNSIGQISIAGARTIFPLGASSTAPGHSDGLTAGPDGNVWFTDTEDGAIGFVKPSGEAVSFSGGDPSTFGPLGITTGPDGNIWFTDFETNRIGRVTLGTFTPIIALSVSEFAITSPNSGPSGIVAGPDGNLWFTEDDAFKIGRMSPAGVMLGEFPIPSPQTGPHLENGIAVGSDGNIWFTEAGTGKIGRLTPP